MATSRTLGNLRKRFQRWAQKARKTAASLGSKDVGYARQLEAEAARLEHLADQSKVGRKGTKQERKERINRAQAVLEQNKPGLTSTRQMTTKKGVQQAQARRERQETIFSKQMQIRSKAGQGGIDQLFLSDTHALWAGAESPSDRFSMIVAGTPGATSISEAYDIWYTENIKQDETIINLILKRDYKSLKQSGWTTDLINEMQQYDAKGEIYKFIDERPWQAY